MEWIKAFQLDKNIIYGWIFIFKIIKIQFFCCPFSSVLSLFGNNFCSRAPIENIYIFPQSLLVFISSKKFSKNHNKNSVCRYLPEIPFLSRTDNGLLEVKLSLISWMFQKCRKRPMLLVNWFRMLCNALI